MNDAEWLACLVVLVLICGAFIVEKNRLWDANVECMDYLKAAEREHITFYFTLNPAEFNQSFGSEENSSLRMWGYNDTTDDGD